MTERPQPHVLVLCKDLMFSSQLNGAVQRAGFVPQTCLGIKTVLEGLTQYPVRCVVVDLELEGLDLEALRAATSGKLVGFGPHVHVARLEAAATAGFDAVLTRGQIAAGLDQWLATQLSPEPRDSIN